MKANLSQKKEKEHQEFKQKIEQKKNHITAQIKSNRKSFPERKRIINRRNRINQEINWIEMETIETFKTETIEGEVVAKTETEKLTHKNLI